jgi:glutamate dehydrogenase
MPTPFTNATEQLHRAAAAMQLDARVMDRLSKPDAIHEFKIPVRMDDGTEREFPAYRVQWNDSRGPFKGGIRFHLQADMDEVKALAFWMTIKTACVGLPLGGGKGGVAVNPKELSAGELERLSRGYVRALASHIGPEKDVPAPDVNTTPQIMAWMVDEYSKIVGHDSFGAFTGKPLTLFGSEGRDAATGQGGFYILDRAVSALSMQAQSTRIAVQGMGNVGSHFARLAQEAGYKVIAMSDSKGGIVVDGGLDPMEVSLYKEKNGSLAGFPGARQVTNAELLELDCDVLVPAALENQITVENAPRIKAKLIIELANGPTTPEADTILAANNVTVVPDVLANAGGVTVSYFEWVQNLQNFYWTEQEVLARLEPIMVSNFEMVWNIARERKIDLRTAAFVHALTRLSASIISRGFGG